MINSYYILRILVYAQSFLWLYLLNRDFEIKSIIIKVLFPVCLVFIYFILHETGFEFNQYTNNLLKYYIVLILFSYNILRFSYPFKNAVCLSFLLVFINSFYWESMLHLNAIIFNGLSFNQFVQSFHLITAYYLYKMFNFHWKAFRIFIYGIIISNLNLLHHNFLPRATRINNYVINRPMINDLTRILCLICLLFIFVNYVDDKKEGEIKLPFLSNKRH